MGRTFDPEARHKHLTRLRSKRMAEFKRARKDRGEKQEEEEVNEMPDLFGQGRRKHRRGGYALHERRVGLHKTFSAPYTPYAWLKAGSRKRRSVRRRKSRRGGTVYM